MKDNKILRHLLTALIVFLLLNLLTLIGGLLNNSFRYDYGTNVFIDTIFVKLIFAGLYFLTTFIKINIDVSLRLPIIRTVFWSAFVVPELFWKPPMDGEVYMILNLVNEGICSLYNSFLHLFIDNNCIGCNLWLDTILPGLILFGLFEFLILKLSNKLSYKIMTRNT